MKFFCKALFLFFTFLLSLIYSSQAQSAVTFNVNLQSELKDSVFIPGRDYLVISGSKYPFSKISNRLADTATPPDSVYSITLKFSNSDVNKQFDYNYIMYVNGVPKKESMKRYIKIPRKDASLDALYFNAFAW